jgi:hypothetical protein
VFNPKLDMPGHSTSALGSIVHLASEWVALANRLAGDFA